VQTTIAHSSSDRCGTVRACDAEPRSAKYIPGPSTPDSDPVPAALSSLPIDELDEETIHPSTPQRAGAPGRVQAVHAVVDSPRH
jgi:hypothetical protein